jgi:uracil-DNA glycosylase family 4
MTIPGKLPNSLELLNTEIIACRKCPRLTAWREKMGLERRRAFRDEVYWSKPVPGFGDPQARVLLLGLAPGAHGSNRTGRMFTGDDSGRFLYAALNKAEFANQPTWSDPNDGLIVRDLWVTAVCRCAPPENKPTIQEMKTCSSFLLQEFNLLTSIQGIVAFGHIAFDAAFRLTQSDRAKEQKLKFQHGGLYQGEQNEPWILTSYHPSRQNTQTGRLTVEMFDQIWLKVRNLIGN